MERIHLQVPPEEEDDTGFSIESSDAFVVVAEVACVNCGDAIEVIAVYCDRGTDLELEQSLHDFTVTEIGAANETLLAQLGRWPSFKQSVGEGGFSNHCSACGVVQEDYRLNSEPGDVFSV